MNGNAPDELFSQTLLQLDAFLYGVPRESTRISLAEVLGGLGEPGDRVEAAIQAMREKNLVRIGIRTEEVLLTPDGKSAHELDCVLELVLGERYIVNRYGPAVTHIIVRTVDGEEAGGSGFFAEEFPGWIVTAQHVIADGRQVLRIEDWRGAVIQDGEIERKEDAEVNLAMVRCPLPAGTIPFRVDWAGGAKVLDRVLVFGYPPVAGHRPDLFVGRSEITQKPWRAGGAVQSLILSGDVRAGCSGGPLVSAAGTVVGVVEEKAVLDRGNVGRPTEFTSATPAHHLINFVSILGSDE